jgi:hypothetical protein
MIKTDDELTIAQECVVKVEQMLVAARRTHTPAQYSMLSKPYLFELQQRQREILEYLMGSAQPAAPMPHAS